MKFSPACNCCGSCTGTVTAAASCNGTTISGATYKLIAADGTTVLSTLVGGTSVTFTSVTGGSSYYVEVSKTGYHTKRSALFSVSCGGTPSITVSTWPTTYNVAIHVRLYNGLACPLGGATVAVAGDATGSGTTDGSGDVTLTLSSTSMSESQSITYTVTPPSGHGAAVKTVSVTVHACSGDSRTISLDPSAGHVPYICNTRYMPDELTWTDDYGSCTITENGAGVWLGSYTYTSSKCIDDATCSGSPGIYPDQTSDVTVEVQLNIGEAGGAGDCGDTDWDIIRAVFLGETNICGSFFVYRCQPYADGCSGKPASALTMTASSSSSCGSSVVLDFTIAAEAATLCATYEETAVDIQITGTIT